MLRAFRPFNLLMIIGLCLTFQVLSFKLKGTDIELFSTQLGTYLLVAVLIAGSGYLLNGYYDRKIDAINIENYQFPFSGKQTLLIFSLANAMAILLSWSEFGINFTLLFCVLPSWLLWIYSLLLKRLPMIGNICIASISVWLPLGLLMINKDLELLRIPSFYGLWTMGLLVEIFVITLAREIIKDIEDLEGDLSNQCKTLPIVFGVTFSSILATILITVGSLIWYNLIVKTSSTLSGITFFSSIVTLTVLLGSIFLLYTRKAHKKRAQIGSLILKLAMVIALITCAII